MKTLVLDTTELRRDWVFRGATAQLLGYAGQNVFLNVCIPPCCIEELVAHHERASIEAARDVERAHRGLARLGMPSFELPPNEFDYRGYLSERFEETLGFRILPWPDVPHERLVAKAVSRQPPFDASGGGYRDALVWESVRELVARGEDVVLASADRAFSGQDGRLAPELAAEAHALSGTVELAQDLPTWLRSNLPWRSATVAESLALAQDEQFWRYYAESDAHDAMIPEAAALGFELAPYSLDVTEVEWMGTVERAATKVGSDGFVLVDYELDMRVEFEAELPASARTDPDWDRSVTGYERIHVTGSIDMVACIGVLFDDELGMSFEQVDWRRADGFPAGQGVKAEVPGTPLFEMD